jgi:hypothetical protein
MLSFCMNVPQRLRKGDPKAEWMAGQLSANKGGGPGHDLEGGWAHRRSRCGTAAAPVTGETVARSSNLRAKDTCSCGCLVREAVREQPVTHSHARDGKLSPE